MSDIKKALWRRVGELSTEKIKNSARMCNKIEFGTYNRQKE